jgi:hypothetical protein
MGVEIEEMESKFQTNKVRFKSNGGSFMVKS